MIGVFPFGSLIKNVIQKDRTPKKVFILGVYASAVHAKWVNPEGKTVVRALAVASEPYIFWRGDGAQNLLDPIKIPPALGTLVPAADQFNGPSGIALDERIINPLGLQREDTWLCDLVPHSCMNPSHKKTLEKNYLPRVEEYSLPIPTVPRVPTRLTDAARREEILGELQESHAEILVLLGDKPIQWFLRYYDNSWQRLSDFPEYGRLYETKIDGKALRIFPLAHPRQIARLGTSSIKWYDIHQNWLNQSPEKHLYSL